MRMMQHAENQKRRRFPPKAFTGTYISEHAAAFLLGASMKWEFNGPD
jgi:hypothetical protein